MYATLLLSLGATAPPMATPPAAPLLYVRVIGPDKAVATFHPATPAARTFPAPITVGVRPGYSVRFQLDNLPPDLPQQAIYPTLDVIGSLHVPPDLKASDHPAAVAITADDVRRALAGGLVTKVLYLENPDIALAATSTPDAPLEIDAVKYQDPLAEARKRGRPVAILRFGGRDVPPGELAATDVPNTVLFPGDGHLASPPSPPQLPSVCFNPFDPIAGPKPPTEEMVADGGDVGLRVGTDAQGRIGNLDPTDTAVQYKYGLGKRVEASNRVCLFAPRFVAVRQERSLENYDTALRVVDVNATRVQALLRDREVSQTFRGPTGVAVNIVREGVRGTESRTGPATIDQYLAAALVSEVEGVRVAVQSVEAETAVQLRNQCKPDQTLVLVKAANPRSAQPGDVVTFKLVFENYGTKIAKEIVIEDSLSPRFEFVPGSAQADRAMAFTLQPNEAGSVLLRWQVAGELPPGQIGVITFQAKLR